MFKKRKNIIKILVELDRNKMIFIDTNKIEEIKQNLHCAYLPELTEEGNKIYRFGKFLLTTNSTNGLDISTVD